MLRPSFCRRSHTELRCRRPSKFLFFRRVAAECPPLLAVNRPDLCKTPSIGQNSQHSEMKHTNMVERRKRREEEATDPALERCNRYHKPLASTSTARIEEKENY